MAQSQQPDGFTRALTKFKKGLDPSLAQQFSICTLEDVRVLADTIQHEQGPQGKLRHLQRLEPFIEAMTQLGTVIEVFTNACDFICFIWGPVKFLLGLAKTHLDSLNKLLEAYGKIASSISGLGRYKEAFQSHPPLAKVLEDYYSDILNFNERAIEVFRRPNWKMLFDAAWKRFDSKFGPILQSLDSRRALLESEKASASLFEIHHALDEIKENGKEQARINTLLEDMKHEQRKELIKKRLNPPNYLRDHQQILQKRAASSGQWIFASPVYRAWHTSGSRVLYVHGKPGGGKSTLMSTVIEKLLDSKPAGVAVAFFYFRHSQDNENTSRGSFDNLLRALLYQLIDQDPDLTDSITNMSGNDRLRLDSTNVLQDLVCKAVRTHMTLYLVLDGLDECQSDEERNIIEWLLGLVQSVLGLRVMLAGQRDNVTDRLLSSQPSISLDTATEHHHDITEYCQKVAEEIRIDFNAEPSLKNTIAKLVSDGAKGMFLYAKVVLQHLLAQPSVEHLEKELKPEVFPDNLEGAYKKVDERVFEKSARVRRAIASEILSYVIGCKRTLFWREIQAFFCINAPEGEVVYKKYIIVNYKELCSSFLDSNAANKNYNGPEDEIVLVHETAREFLIRHNRVNIHEQQLKLSAFCFKYLTSPPFSLGVSEEDVLLHAKKGYYALQDYTVQYWFDHLLDCVKSLDPMSGGNKCQEIFNLALVFLKSYGDREKVKELLQAETYIDLAGTIIKNLPTHGRERNSYLSIDIRTESLRQKIAQLDFEAFTVEEQRVFVNLHGPKTSYKCSKPWCDFFKGDLMSQANRQKHIDQHEFPYRCAYKDCVVGFKLGFSTEDDLQRHNGEWHAQEHEDDANTFPKLDLSSSFSGNSNETNLAEACKRGDIERVKQLLEFDGTEKELDKPCGPSESFYPLSLAAGMGHKEICALLISHGASINIGAGASLQQAAEHGRLEVCEFLTSNGADVNISRRPNGFTPLHLAARRGHLEVCKLLMQRGANINSKKARGGITPLHTAAEKGNIDIITLLLHQDGIETNTKSYREKTPAQMAAAAGRTQALRLMKSSGKVDMNVGLLRLACSGVPDSLDTIKYLLNNDHVDEVDETCVWTVLKTVSTKRPKYIMAKVGLAVDMLFSTGNLVFGDVISLASELGYESEKQLKEHKLALLTWSLERMYTSLIENQKRWTEKRTPFLILIMEYPKWRIKGSAWSKFLDLKKEVGMEIDPELAKNVDKFVERIEDNRSTTIIDDEPEVKGKGRSA
ncbi:hypothetical protein QBC32DRAFT_348975 [Pseudoneurospora amorphoporcata]|uniref:NACHT domain-containing protein n=1 Tax=Pseudoneurospora amorphoporcata TaxID=241081 RepID=A0AAN6NP74_9PEZI|nr:hypothetical protein QBC32DRAFT_348975 [Pseudoneurospora amorphoporcata]